MNAGPVTHNAQRTHALRAPIIGVTSPTDLQHYRGWEVGPRHVAHGGTTKNTSGKSLSATRGISRLFNTSYSISAAKRSLNQN